jgi:hypothetical protein
MERPKGGGVSMLHDKGRGVSKPGVALRPCVKVGTRNHAVDDGLSFGRGR